MDILSMRQSDLAHACRCKQAWISKIENGYIPRPWNLEKIKNGINSIKNLGHKLSIDDLKRLIGGTKNKTVPVVFSTTL